MDFITNDTVAKLDYKLESSDGFDNITIVKINDYISNSSGITDYEKDTSFIYKICIQFCINFNRDYDAAERITELDDDVVSDIIINSEFGVNDWIALTQPTNLFTFNNTGVTTDVSFDDGNLLSEQWLDNGCCSVLELVVAYKGDLNVENAIKYLNTTTHLNSSDLDIPLSFFINGIKC